MKVSKTVGNLKNLIRGEPKTQSQLGVHTQLLNCPLSESNNQPSETSSSIEETELPQFNFGNQNLIEEESPNVAVVSAAAPTLPS